MCPNSVSSRAVLKVLILWSHPSGYIHDCINELARFADVSVLYFAPSLDAPFDSSIFSGCNYRLLFIHPPLINRQDFEMARELVAEGYDICFISGWNHTFYLRLVSRHLLHSCLRVICFDWQWRSTPRNYVKALYGSLFKSRFFHAAFVPGERQYQFATRCGFSPFFTYQGLYSAGSCEQHNLLWSNRKNIVIYLGRLVQSKGCSDLIEAWNLICAAAPLHKIWKLGVVGTGPMMEQFMALKNCDVYGFLQPAEVSKLLSVSKILCAPSLEEPWGVQIHEAVSHGLAVVASSSCGSAVHLVQPEFNGELIPPSNPGALAQSIQRLVLMDQEVPNRLEAYSQNSMRISPQFSPQRWANTVFRIYHDLRNP